MTFASRDTTTGARFEERISINSKGVNLTKNKLYKYLTSKGKNYKSVISKKLLPDEAYFNLKTKEFNVYEKKFQCNEGSADEKLQTCAFKIQQFRKIGTLLEAEKVTYTYILSEWFRRDMYKDVLEYIKSVPGCDYIFEDDIVSKKPENKNGFCFGYF